MSLHYSFAGKRVLITGGAQGIGRQLVQRFHDGGAIVFTVDKNSETIAKLKEELPSVTAEIVDLTDWNATQQVLESFGQIDHLVNNAAIGVPQTVMSVTEEMASLQFAVNFAAVINVTQVIAKKMIADGTGGTIVNISSLTAKLSHPLVTVYSALKAALVNLTKSMALEFGPSNIRVNCVLPTIVETPMWDTLPEQIKEALGGYTSRQVIQRRISADEIADTVLFLLSPLSSMIVGQDILIDGGCL